MNGRHGVDLSQNADELPLEDTRRGRRQIHTGRSLQGNGNDSAAGWRTMALGVT
jgi:hypothetical protein